MAPNTSNAEAQVLHIGAYKTPEKNFGKPPKLMEKLSRPSTPPRLDEASHVLNRPVPNHYATKSPATPSSNTRTCNSNSDSQSFPVPSPADTASTASSPGATNDIWDLPETPYTQQSVRKSTREILTPFTPPTAYNPSVKQQYVSIPILALSDDKAAHTLRTFNQGGHELESDDDDYFGLPRNLTGLLQALKNDNEKAVAQANYNTIPSLNFSQEQSTTARDYKSSKSKRKDGLSNNKTQLKSEEAQAGSGSKASSSTSSWYLEHIIPSNVHERLLHKRSVCVASIVKDPQRRCTNQSQGPLDEVDNIFREISRIDSHSDFIKLPETILLLAPLIMCGSHRNAALNGPSSNPRMNKLQKFVSNPSKSSQEQKMFKTWLRAVSKLKTHSDTGHTTESANEVEEECVTKKLTTAQTKIAQPSTSKTTTSDTILKTSYGMRFESYQTKKGSKLTVSEAIREWAIKPLKATDEKDGFVYIFWEEGIFGKVKIGRTDNLEKRLRDWNRSCKRIYKYHKNSECVEDTAIPHHSRIERLIHTELKDVREEAWCEACKKRHIEWFNISPEQAKKVYKKWETWILQRPYAEDPVSKEWKIRPEMEHTLEDMCVPVPLQTIRHPPRRKSERLQQKTKGKQTRKTM